LRREGQALSKTTEDGLARVLVQRPVIAIDSNRSKAMTQSPVVLIVCAALGVTISLAHAGPCGDEIAQLRDAVSRFASNPAAGPTAPQSLEAQLRRQPTPESVKRAQEQAQSRFAAALARGEALDAEGRHAECLQAITDAKRMLGLN
jgi:hypothetical protein